MKRSRFQFLFSFKFQVYQLRSITNQLKMAYKGQDVEWWDRELERRDKSSSGTLFEGSGDDDDDQALSYDGREDDEDFAGNVEGSGSFESHDDIDVDAEDFADGGSGDGDLERSSEAPKVNEPWRPWSPEEIEVIKPTSTEAPTTSTSRPKSSSGFRSSGCGCFVVLLLSLVSFFSSKNL